VVERFLKKGSKVYIEGQLETRKWQDQSGADKYSTEVVLRGFNSTLQMLDGPSGGSQQSGGYDSYGSAPAGGAPGAGTPGRPDYDDEIPFRMDGRL
jgi:single-strand DNA-binding protein